MAHLALPSHRLCRHNTVQLSVYLIRPQVEKAGGHSSADGQCISSLDVEIKEYDQRTQVEPVSPSPVTPPHVCHLSS